jgi:DNA-binding phage protein
MPSREHEGSAEGIGSGWAQSVPRDVPHARIAPVDADRAQAALLATFATNVRARADELGLTLSDVAEQAGIPRATLHAVLSARRTPTLITLVKIGGAIGSNVVELFLDAATPPKKKR